MNEIRRDKYVLMWDEKNDTITLILDEKYYLPFSLNESRRLMYDLAKAVTEREDYLIEGCEDVAGQNQ